MSVSKTYLPENTEITEPKLLGLGQNYWMGWKAFWNNKSYGEAIVFTDLKLSEVVRERLIERAYECWLHHD